MPLPNIIMTAIISLVICMEWLSQWNEHKHSHVKQSTNTNILVGVLFAAVGFITNGLIVVFLTWLSHLSLFQIDTAWYQWIIIFLILDWVHFLVHYLEHNVRFLWAIHAVHHSSSIFNFSTAIRGPLGTAVYRIIYAAPLCAIGFDPFRVLLVDQLIILYAFFLHTERIKKLGPLEFFLNTPSHHRVHHGSNEEYLDKNYGACLIIWDKLFGTFREERSRPVYGLTNPLTSSNPLHIIAHEWILIKHDMTHAPGACNGLKILINKPSWKPKLASHKSTSATGAYPKQLLPSSIRIHIHDTARGFLQSGPVPSPHS